MVWFTHEPAYEVLAMILGQWVWRLWLKVLGQVLIWVTVLITFAGFMSQVPRMNQYFGVTKAFWYLLCCLPGSLYKLMPLIFILVFFIIIFHFHKSHLLRSWYGLSLSPVLMRRHLFKYFAAWMCVFFIMGEVLAPQAEQYAKNKRLEWQTNHQVVAASKGVWLKEKNGFAHAYLSSSHQRVTGVQRFLVGPKGLESYQQAKEARYVNGVWTIMDVTIQNFSDEQSVSQETAKEVVWPIDLDIDLISLSQVKPQYRSIINFSKLLLMDDFYGLFHLEDQILLVTRLLNPVVMLVCIWLSLGTVLPQVSRQKEAQSRKNVLILLLTALLWCYASSDIIEVLSMGHPWVVYLLMSGGFISLWWYRSTIHLQQQLKKENI